MALIRRYTLSMLVIGNLLLSVTVNWPDDVPELICYPQAKIYDYRLFKDFTQAVKFLNRCGGGSLYVPPGRLHTVGSGCRAAP
jgi:hypothetical protein